MAKSHVIRNLFDGRGDLYKMAPEKLVIIGRDTDHKKGDHPLWDERAKYEADPAMVKSIKTYGVLEPVIARTNGEEIQLVDGRGRTIAARVASDELVAEGKQPLLIPVVLRKGTDADQIGVMITANEIRRGDEFRIKAEKAKRAAAAGHDTEAIAAMFGVSDQTVLNWMAFFDLSSKVQKAIESEQISVSAALKLSKMSREEQDAEVEKLIEAGGGRKVTTAQVTNHKRAATVSEDVAPVPPKRLLNKLVEVPEAKELEGRFIDGVRFAIGQLSAKRIGGLTAMLDDLQAKKSAAMSAGEE